MTITDDKPTVSCGHHNCLHPVCAGGCDRPLRTTDSQKIADHPGSVPHKNGGWCKRCIEQSGRLIPSDLEDQSHILISDEELAKVMQKYPSHFWWLMERRARIARRKKVTA